MTDGSTTTDGTPQLIGAGCRSHGDIVTTSDIAGVAGGSSQIRGCLCVSLVGMSLVLILAGAT